MLNLSGFIILPQKISLNSWYVHLLGKVKNKWNLVYCGSVRCQYNWWLHNRFSIYHIILVSCDVLRLNHNGSACQNLSFPNVNCIPSMPKGCCRSTAWIAPATPQKPCYPCGHYYIDLIILACKHLRNKHGCLINWSSTSGDPSLRNSYGSLQIVWVGYGNPDAICLSFAEHSAV